MDSFESLIATIFRSQGYWVIPSFKVELSKPEKREMGLPSSPRWELDLIAYRGATNEVLVIECKSYLNSPGVRFSAFETGAKLSERFKLFTNKEIRRVVLERLRTQLVEEQYCPSPPQVTLCLAAGHIATEDDRAELRRRFKRDGWLLFDEEWLFKHLERLGKSDYENEVAIMVAKLFRKYREADQPSRTEDE